MSRINSLDCKIVYSRGEEELEIKCINAVNGEINWKTVRFPVKQITKTAVRLLIFNSALLKKERELERYYRILLPRLLRVAEGTEKLLTYEVKDILTGAACNTSHPRNECNIRDRLIACDRANRAVVIMVLRKYFGLLTPAIYNGYLIPDRRSPSNLPAKTGPCNLELPQDALMEVYKNIESIEASSMFTLASKAMFMRYNKPGVMRNTFPLYRM